MEASEALYWHIHFTLYLVHQHKIYKLIHSDPVLVFNGNQETAQIPNLLCSANTK